MRILLVEDERKIASFIQRGLKEESYAVDLAAEGGHALYLADINEYDLIILDIMLPGEDGISVCRKIRENGNDTPILMLTARNSLDDKIQGFDVGADDYLTKPFAFEEFLARVRVLIKRKYRQVSAVLKCGALELDPKTRKVRREGREIALSNKEFALLEYLLRHTGEIVTRTMISEHVWNESFDSFTNVIDVYIRYLRHKIDSDFDTPLIHTIRGVGYIIRETPP